MRRASFVLVLLSAVGCGNFLGFGDDDEPETAADAGAPEAGGDTGVADGGDALPLGCTRHAIRFEASTDVDAAVAAAGWDVYRAGNATLAIEDGQLVLRGTGQPANVTDEANVSFRQDGQLTRLTCTSTMKVSSFEARDRFVWLRLFGPEWTTFYSAYAEWTNGQLFAPVQGERVNDGGSIDRFPATSPLPPTGTALPLFVELVASETATKLEVRLGDVTIASGDHAPTGPLTYTRAIFGVHTPIGIDAGPYEVRYDAIECVTCVAP